MGHYAGGWQQSVCFVCPVCPLLAHDLRPPSYPARAASGQLASLPSVSDPPTRHIVQLLRTLPTAIKSTATADSSFFAGAFTHSNPPRDFCALKPPPRSCDLNHLPLPPQVVPDRRHRQLNCSRLPKGHQDVPGRFSGMFIDLLARCHLTTPCCRPFGLFVLHYSFRQQAGTDASSSLPPTRHLVTFRQNLLMVPSLLRFLSSSIAQFPFRAI